MPNELRHDRHTVSLLTGHMVFSPKYRGKVLVGKVAMLAEAIIRKICKELEIEIIDMSVSPDHVLLLIQYPLKYSVSFIAKRLKGRSSRILRQEFPELKEWCKKSLWIPSCFHGRGGQDGLNARCVSGVEATASHVFGEGELSSVDKC